MKNCKPFDFESVEIIGKGRLDLPGAYGKVVKAILKETGESFAVKQVDKAAMEMLGLEEQLMNEITILQRLKHANILRLHGCFEDVKTVYLVMELATSGSLFKTIKKEGLSEQRAVAVN